MKNKPFAAALATLLLAAPLTAFAVPLQITLQGDFQKDIFSTSIFGITDASVPIQISFAVDDGAGTTLAAGTPIFPTGEAFVADAHLFSAGSVSNLVATIGDASFGTADFQHRTVGATALPYDVLLLGSLTDNGVSAVLLGFTNTSGVLEFGAAQCIVTCGVLNLGFAQDFLAGAFADVNGVQVFSQLASVGPVEVPEPSSLALLGVGILALVLSRRRQSA
jgi:PEP-CTERM motif-containing protein